MAVAVPPHLACLWQAVASFGGYEVVLKPFSLAECGPILWNADRYAREFPSATHLMAPLQSTRAAIGEHAGGNQHRGLLNPRGPHREGLRSVRSFAGRASRFYQVA